METYTPKYIKIEQYIMKNIKSGKYKVGMKIPSENKLSEKFDVSRVTANKAITELANQGVVRRIQGKGTFVSKLSVMNKELYHNTSKSIKISSETAESRTHKTVSIEIIEDDVYLINKLNLIEDTKVYKIKRLTLSNGIPIVIDSSYIPSIYLGKDPDFTILDRSYIHEYLEYIKGIDVSYLHVHIDAKMPDKYEMKILNVSRKQPLVIWDTNVLDKNKKVVAFTTSIAHPKKYRAYINFDLK